MSQLDNVLRRSIAHLSPSDPEGRARVFASAREAMIRLLRVYDPPLTSFEIASKIREFDVITDAIERELAWARPMALPSLPPPATARTFAAPRLALPAPEAELAEAEPEEDADDAAAEEEEPGLEDGEDDEFRDDDDEDGDYYDDYDDDEFADDGEARDGRSRPLDRLMDFVDGLGWRSVAAAAVAVLALGGLALWLVSGRASTRVAPAPVQQAAPAETAAAPAPAPAPEAEPAQAAPATAPPPAATATAGDLALETLVLFDGRDPSVFQSAPDNPVSFQGDADGGFARIASSTVSTGARIAVGRGVYERIAGHRIRLVLVVRAARTAPATGLRFAYQNGRVQSPWTDVPITASYAPLSFVWTAPKERGGPENDAVIIEPGLPGDGTAIDVRSVRIEILG